MEDCVFCKIIAGDIPAKKVYEDAEFLAFLDLRPLNPGHTLIIPKKHYRWVWDVKNIGKYYEVVGEIAQAIRRALNIKYVVSMVFGEEVKHAHIWLVPRFKNDGHGGAINLDNVKKIDSEEMEKIAEKIRKEARSIANFCK